ncbi:MAG TPA: hypothetical protein VIK91_24380 [Nannocystis sp.]
MTELRKVLALVLLAAGCSPEKGGGSEGTTGSGSATSTTSGTGSTGGESTTSGPSPTSTTGETSPTNGGLACEDYLVEPSDLSPVAITFRNPGSEPVWVGALDCGKTPNMRIVDANQENLVIPTANCFPVACQDFLKLDDCSPGCDDCAIPDALRVLPNSEFGVNWPGIRTEAVMMTAACAPGTNCQRECLIAHKAAPGPYTLGLTVFRTCTGPGCGCADPTENFCPLEGVVLGDPIEIEVPFTLPETTAIEVMLSEP